MRSYVARCLCGCGAIVVARLDHPENKANTAAAVAKLIREGHDIETMTTEQVRAAQWGCEKERPCGEISKQGIFAL